jgi:hypothetical protein
MMMTESQLPAETDAHDLEAVLLELAFEFVDFTTTSFETAVRTAAEKIPASVLFNVRFDQPRYQRAAAVETKPQGKLYLLLLDRRGRKVDVLGVPEDHRRVVEEVREWAARPLAMQASVDSQTQLKLLLYAACVPLRAAG